MFNFVHDGFEIAFVDRAPQEGPGEPVLLIVRHPRIDKVAGAG